MVESLYWVWFQIMFGYGTARSHDLITAFKSPKVLYDTICANDPKPNILTKHESSYFSGSLEKARRIVDITLKKKCCIITPDHSDYPEKLQHIYGKPAALYVKGNLSKIKDKLVFAVVGSRKYSEYGQKAAEFITDGLAKNGAAIVSGLALGIDSIALSSSVDAGSSAVGVLACGLDYDYPKNSSALKRKIVEQGAVITEYPMGTIPKPQMFPVRNRIISGMSDGVIVVEASDQSGALITANTAFEQNREVYVVPGEVFSGKYLGSHQLIKNGIGKIINGPTDILIEFPGYNNIITPKPDIHDNENKETALSEQKTRKELPKGMDEAVYKIYNAVDDSEQTADQLSVKAGVEISVVLGTVTTLELLGFIKYTPGGYFTLE